MIFEANRERVDLAELARRYTDLSRCGRSLRGLCPFPDHDETEPSFNVYPDGRFHCYGCGRRGDATDFWAHTNGLEPGIEAALDLAREYRIELPEMDPEARERTRQRREREDRHLQQAEVCHRALSLHRDVEEWWEQRGFDRELRERFLLGANEDGTEAIIPYWHRGRVQGLICRKLEGEPRYLYPRAEDFAGGYRPLFIPGPVRGGVLAVSGLGG